MESIAALISAFLHTATAALISTFITSFLLSAKATAASTVAAISLQQLPMESIAAIAGMFVFITVFLLTAVFITSFLLSANAAAASTVTVHPSTTTTTNQQPPPAPAAPFCAVTAGSGEQIVTSMESAEAAAAAAMVPPREPEAAHMRYKNWPGNLAEDAVEMVETMILEQPSVNLEDDMDSDFNNSTPMDVPDGSTVPSTSTTVTSKGEKKRDRVNDVATKCLTDMVATFNKVFEDTNSSLAKIADYFSYANLNDTKMKDLHKNLKEQLAQLPLTQKQRVKALMLLSKDDTFVRLFHDMEDNEERMEMIEELLKKDA